MLALYIILMYGGCSCIANRVDFTISTSDKAGSIINLPRHSDLKSNKENNDEHCEANHDSEYDSQLSKHTENKITFKTLYPRFETFRPTLRSTPEVPKYGNKTKWGNEDTDLTINKKIIKQKYDAYLNDIIQNIKGPTKAITKAHELETLNKILKREKPVLKFYHHAHVNLTTDYRSKENKSFNRLKKERKIKKYTHSSPMHIIQTLDAKQTDTRKIRRPMAKQTETRPITSYKIVTESPKKFAYKDDSRVLEIPYKVPYRFSNWSKSIVIMPRHDSLKPKFTRALYMQPVGIPKNKIGQHKLLSIYNITSYGRTSKRSLAFIKGDYLAELRQIKRRGNYNNIINDNTIVKKPVSHRIEIVNKLNVTKSNTNDIKPMAKMVEATTRGQNVSTTVKYLKVNYSDANVRDILKKNTKVTDIKDNFYKTEINNSMTHRMDLLVASKNRARQMEAKVQESSEKEQLQHNKEKLAQRLEKKTRREVERIRRSVPILRQEAQPQNSTNHTHGPEGQVHQLDIQINNLSNKHLRHHDEFTQLLNKELQRHREEQMYQHDLLMHSLQEQLRLHIERLSHNRTVMTENHEKQFRQLKEMLQLDKNEQAERDKENNHLLQEELQLHNAEKSKNLIKLFQDQHDEIQHLKEKLELNKKELVDLQEVESQKLQETIQNNYEQLSNNMASQSRIHEQVIQQLEDKELIERDVRVQQLDKLVVELQEQLRLHIKQFNNRNTLSHDHKEQVEELGMELQVNKEETRRLYDEQIRLEEEQTLRLVDQMKRNKQELLHKLKEIAHRQDVKIKELEKQIHFFKSL